MSVRASLICLAFALASAPVCATEPAPPQYQYPPPPPSSPLVMTPQLQKRLDKSKHGSAGMVAFWKRQRELSLQAGFSGESGMAHHYVAGYGEGNPNIAAGAQDSKGQARKAGQPWRWASVTKQVMAVLVMQEVVAGHIDLDKPVRKYLRSFASRNAKKLTVRQLLRHQSGLPNPDDTASGPDGVPAYYRMESSINRDPVNGYCAGKPKAVPGGQWEYNNCDYIVAGALLEAVTGQPWRKLVEERIAKTLYRQTPSSFPTSREAWPGWIGGKPEATRDLTSYESSGALVGSISGLLKFDVLLMTGKFLPKEALAEMWDGKPELGFIALGQWSFDANLSGCATPVRIIERRGAIGGVQVRNLMVPEMEIAVALFTDQAEFDFGEIWQGKGFSFDMLSLAACAKEGA